MRVLLTILLCSLAACNNIPPPVNPEFQEAGAYRNLSNVPVRPKVLVPLGQRTEWQNELKTGAVEAEQVQRDVGLTK